MINIKTALKVLHGEYFLFVSGDGNSIKIDRKNANDIADLITRQQAVCNEAKILNRCTLFNDYPQTCDELDHECEEYNLCDALKRLEVKL